MTTPLPAEPRSDNGLVPYMTLLADRLYDRLPEVYRTFDAADQTYPLKRYLGAMLNQGGLIDDTIEAVRGDRPLGPAAPEPWGLRADELAVWRASRVARASALGDPEQAEVSWLPWLAQLVGATLDPSASDQEKRDTIKYATSGWRGGTRSAIADAAKTALTGTRYARVVPHTVPMGGSLVAGDIWDLTIVTRASETPDPSAVLGAILRKGVKPAGVVLHHATYGATWDQIENIYPMWWMWEELTWDELEQAGLMYVALPGNLIANPSFEVDASGWTAAANSTIGRITGGVDGVGMLRVTATAAGTAGVTVPDIAATPGNYHFSFAVRPDQSRTPEYVVSYYNGVSLISSETKSAGTLTADEWTRVGTDTPLTAPASTTRISILVRVPGMGAAELYDVDAFFARGL